MRTTDFDFDLPQELIAQFPASERSASRLLRLDGNTGALADQHFRELPAFLKPGDLLIFNDTRVIKARLHGQKASGGSVEVLIERILDDHTALAHVRASRAPKAGNHLSLANGHIDAVVRERRDDLFLLEFTGAEPILTLLERHGQLPLPPYIAHNADQTDEERYQTVYAREAGAVAAPTAGLHFDEAMIERLAAHGVKIAYITLHVGAGTFQPVRVDDIREHKMHSELYSVSAETVQMIHDTQAAGGKVTAVGTTVLRALESAARNSALAAGNGETDIFITPGYRFQVVERLLTNFHLPKSTLLMLVSAFAGLDHIQSAYRHAVAQRYRFFSYGDAMLLERQEPR